MSVDGAVSVFPAESRGREERAVGRSDRGVVLPAGCGGSSGGGRSSSTTASTPSSRARLVPAEKRTGIVVHLRTNDSVVLADQILQEGVRRPTST